MCTICASSVSGADLLRAHDQRALPLIVAPVTRLPGFLGTGTGSPVIIDSSPFDAPSRQVPSIGTFSPDARAGGRHLHLGERHLAFAAIRLDAQRGVRRQREQLLDGLAGLAERAQLQHLAQLHQRDDHAAASK